MKIGVIVERLHTDFWQAVAAVKRIGIDGIQSYTNAVVRTDMTPTQIREFRRRLDGEGISFSALCGDFGCRMFYRPEDCARELDTEKRVMDLAVALGCGIVTTHIGAVPPQQNCRQYESMHRVCKMLADFADAAGGRFAVETGPETAETLKRFLDGLQSKGVGVNLDPANLVMCAADDPVRAVYTLRDYIVHTHAKDGVQLQPVDTLRLYAAEYYGLEPLDGKLYIRETPLGEGGVPWRAYLDALQDIGYDGYLTIEREAGKTPLEDTEKAVVFLRELLRA